MKKDTRLLFLILLLSIVTRSIGLERRGIWYDDAFSILLSGLPVDRLIAGTAADTMPPLYYLLLHAWMQLNTAIGFLRLPGVLFSTAAVALLYAWVTRIAGPRAGLWAAFLAAIAPFQIYYAQEIRPYALLECAQMGYLVCFTRIWQRSGRWFDWAGLVICGVAAMYSHNLAVFGLLAPLVFLALHREAKLLAKLVAALALVALLSLPWIMRLPGQVAHIQGGWSILAPGVVELLQAIIITTSNLPLAGAWLAAALLVSVWVLALLLLEFWRGRPWPAGAGLLLAVTLTAPLLMLLASYLLRPVFVPRGFLVAVLAYNGLAGMALARSGWRAWLLAGLFVAGALIALPGQIIFDEFPRSPHRTAAQYLAASAQPQDVILHDNKLSYFPVQVYAAALEQSFLPDITGGHNDTLSAGTQQALQIFPQPDLSTAVGDARRVYFVVYIRAIEEYAQMGQPQHPALAWLEQHFRLVGRAVFGDLEIDCFER